MSQYTQKDAVRYAQQLKRNFKAEYETSEYSPQELEMLFNMIESLLKENINAIGYFHLQSIEDVLKELHEDKISLNPNRRQAGVCLAPYYDTGLVGAQLCKSYRGYRDAAVKAGRILSARPTLVYENDSFEWIDSFTVPRHSYDPFSPNSRGAIRGSYCVTELVDHQLLVTTFTYDELMQTSQFVQVASGAWQDFFTAMLLAKSVRLSEKSWPSAQGVMN